MVQRQPARAVGHDDQQDEHPQHALVEDDGVGKPVEHRTDELAAQAVKRDIHHALNDDEADHAKRGQPAEQAGLVKDDQLIAVDGTEITPEMTVDQIVLLIRGEIGTNVVLSVVRAGESEPLQITIDALTDALLSHLSYEERELVEPLARVGFMPGQV